MDPLTASLIAAGITTIGGGLLDWAFGGNDQPKMPKQAGQALPDTKPPLQVPEVPVSQFTPPQMGGGRQAPMGGQIPSDILSQALQRWMGR